MLEQIQTVLSRRPLRIVELERFPHDQLLAAIDASYDSEDLQLQENIFTVCEKILGESAAPWLRRSLELPVQNMIFDRYCAALNACLPTAEGIALAEAKLASEQTHQLARTAHDLLEFEDKSLIIDWIERRLAVGDAPVVPLWGQLAVLAGLKWERAKAWLDQGKPLNLVALDAILAWVQQDVELGGWLDPLAPQIIDAPPTETLKTILEAEGQAGTPRVEATVKSILQHLR